MSSMRVVRYYESGFCVRDIDGVVEDIVEERKKVESRVYKLPDKMIDKPCLMIATYGSANKESKGVAEVTFSGYYVYENSDDFYSHENLHLVKQNDTTSPWSWDSNGNSPKYGWIITKVTKFDKPYALSKRPGIKFSCNMGICE